MKKFFVYSALALLLLLGVFMFVLPAQVTKRANAVLAQAPYTPSESALALHQRLEIVDLHCDALLWNRNLLERSKVGHVDVPRLLAGNVALEAFTIVSKVPFGLNMERNDSNSDMITVLAIAQRWPPRTWGSLKERALYQAKKLHEFAARSQGKLVLIKTAADLQSYLARRQTDHNLTAGFLGIEGAQVLEGDLANIDVLFDAGFRMMAPTHFFDNDIAGSAHGAEKGGLTEKGKEMIRRMEAKRMLVDVAHASPQTIDDVLTIATKPVLVSHTGVKGTCDGARNLSDDHIKRIAQTGGVIGIAYFDAAVCATDVQAIVKAIRYTADLAGVEHVGLGSDFDGAVSTPFDTAGLVQLTEALMAEGFSEKEIGLIMGGNVMRVLQENLP
ncbi:dipeptidase [candidate division KSB1 bacterium]|nr:dipeptidase [candidate division KSB1 bacterium]